MHKGKAVHVLGASPVFQSPMTSPNARTELAIITMCVRYSVSRPLREVCISAFHSSFHRSLPLPLVLQGGGHAVDFSGPTPPSLPGLQHMLLFMGLSQVDANTQVPDGGSGRVSGPPDTSGCISTLPPPLLLRTPPWRSETCPETPAALGPQSTLPSGYWVGGNLLPIVCFPMPWSWLLW